jgi:tetratricopeptide (TPR) repeat protein
MRHDDNDRALADYDQAIRMMPDFEPAFVARGFVYLFARPDPDRAIADFSEAIRLDPASFAVRLGREQKECTGPAGCTC